MYQADVFVCSTPINFETDYSISLSYHRHAPEHWTDPFGQYILKVQMGIECSPCFG